MGKQQSCGAEFVCWSDRLSRQHQEGMQAKLENDKQMKLSAPIYRLKRQAKTLSREAQIPLHEALDRIAVNEGFASWSLLAAHHAQATPAAKLYAQLKQGDLILIAARPGHGKTLLSLELAVEAMKSGHRAFFFSLEFTEAQCHQLFDSIQVNPVGYEHLFEFDGSDSIHSDHIIRKLSKAPKGTLAVVDYLQLLDQRRESPPLMAQIKKLKAFAEAQGITLVFISQIDRAYNADNKPLPDLEDVRLPNPVDLKLFSKTVFLHDGEMRLSAIG